MAERKQVELADLIDYITDQLRAAAERAAKNPYYVMQFEECELETAIKIEADAKAGLKVWVLELGGGVKRSDANTIKLKFKALSASEPEPDGTEQATSAEATGSSDRQPSAGGGVGAGFAGGGQYRGPKFR